MNKQQYRDARKLIERPEHWTRDEFARDANGERVIDIQSDEAVRFCARGACAKVLGYRQGALATREDLSDLKSAAISMGHEYIAELNDRRTHATVLKMFDRAIELAEEA